jgi:protoporphyrin/coproporphyrin ferrochelatase
MKTGILIANTGSPASPEPDAIEAYLREFLLDDRICQMPKPIWKYIVCRHILPKRKFSSAKRYEFIWTAEGSPLIVNQQRLAQKLQVSYDADANARSTNSAVADADAETNGTAAPLTDLDRDIVVRSAMSYGSPSIDEELAYLRNIGCERIILLPLYPQSAYSPTQAVIDAYKRAERKIHWMPESVVIDNYHANPLYIKAIAQNVRDRGFNPEAGDKLALSFHAIPLKDEHAGDTYRTQVAESAKLITKELGIPTDSVSVSYQSVFGHNEEAWASPLSIHLLPKWRDEDFRVFFCCPGFAIDCLETLFDVPNELCPALEGEDAKPIATCAETKGDIQAACNTNGRFVWVPCLNDDDRHVEILRDVIDSRR